LIKRRRIKIIGNMGGAGIGNNGMGGAAMTVKEMELTIIKFRLRFWWAMMKLEQHMKKTDRNNVGKNINEVDGVLNE
jgi:hypothetical protein